MLDPTPLINGRRYAFASIEAAYNGQRTIGFKAINYKHSLKPGTVRGASPRILGSTVGIEEVEAGFEMFKEEYTSFVRLLGPGYKTKYFPIVVSYSTSESSGITVDEIIDCRIQDDEDSHAEGEEALTVKVTLWARTVLRDGIPAILDS